MEAGLGHSARRRSLYSEETAEKAFAMARRRFVVDASPGAQPTLVPAPLCSDVMPFRTMRAGIGVQRFVRALALAKPGIRDAWACENLRVRPSQWVTGGYPTTGQ